MDWSLIFSGWAVLTFDSCLYFFSYCQSSCGAAQQTLGQKYEGQSLAAADLGCVPARCKMNPPGVLSYVRVFRKKRRWWGDCSVVGD